MLRDSGYSESLHSASYEEFVLPSINKDKTPPPLPPKSMQSQPNSESNGINNYSIIHKQFLLKYFIFILFFKIY